jgi:predicted thioesterase
MNTSEYIKPGIKKKKDFIVKADHTTSHVGSGTIHVLATPAMIAYMEITSNRLLQANLPDGFSSVGTSVNIRHLAPTNQGMTVIVRTEVLSVDGDNIELKVTVHEGEKLVGDGFHGRHVIDNARFLNGLNN